MTGCKSIVNSSVAVMGGFTRSMGGSGQLNIPPAAVCESVILPRILFTHIIN